MEPPHGVQLVTVEDDHSYHLNEKELEKLLLREDVKDLPVAVVSVAGAFRTGKSFLLNFFLRYLSSPPSARADGTWIGDDTKELTGFSWRAGSVRNTTGILMWSEPYKVTLPSGEQVAVLLLDTQGTFDDNSTIRDSSTIIALASLLSSTQIYNIMSQITEADLQNLQLFIDYGKLMKNSNGKSFQVLEFLIRDWMNDWEYAYGQEGGEQYLANKFKTDPNQPSELKGVHQHILDSFEKVTCFLMPHPGLKAGRTTFKGKLNEISVEFIDEMKDLAVSIFSAEKLTMKRISGQPIKGHDLFNLFKSYMTVFNSEKIPTPTILLQATTDAGLLLTSNQVREQFEKNLDLACGTTAPSMPTAEVIDIHQRELAAARATFNAKKLFGDQVEINKKIEELMQELDERQKQFIEINMAKTLKAIGNGCDAFDKVIEDVTKGNSLCVHPTDLNVMYENALKAALNAFNNNRKIRDDGKDADRDKLTKDLEEKKESLQQLNDHNNKLLVAELKVEYMEHMMNKVKQEPNLCAAPFDDQHHQAQKKASEQFESMRNMRSSHSADVYKTMLLQDIELEYYQVKQINYRSNDKLLQKALETFNARSVQPSQLRELCLHPSNLEKKHEEAKNFTLRVISPNQLCEGGHSLLMQRMRNQYEVIKAINNSANEAAVNSAYRVYKTNFDSHKHWNWAFVSWRKARKYHDEALNDKARPRFYNFRMDANMHDDYSITGNGYYDPYYKDLVDKCEKYYRNS